MALGALVVLAAACGGDPELTIRAATTTSVAPTTTTVAPASTTTLAPTIGNAEDRAPSIPRWNGHDAAISWNFDDALPSHLDRVVPWFDALARPATFYPTCGALLSAADAWAEIAPRHEIGNHTMTHAPAGPDTDPAEITVCHEVLTETLGEAPATFAYTSGVVDEPYISFSREQYVAARASWGLVSHVEPDRIPNWYELPAYTVEPAGQDPDGTRIDRTVAAIEAAIADGGWLSVVLHAIDEPGYATITFTDLERMMAATEASFVWHATVGDVATHDRIRRDVERIRPVQADDGSWSWRWTVVPGMTDVGIRLDPGTGRIHQGGADLAVDPQGFVVLDPYVGSFTWIPD